MKGGKWYKKVPIGLIANFIVSKEWPISVMTEYKHLIVKAFHPEHT